MEIVLILPVPESSPSNTYQNVCPTTPQLELYSSKPGLLTIP